MTKLFVDNFELTLQLEVSATFHRFRAGYHERGGGQIDPDEPAHWEIHSVTAYCGTYAKEIGAVMSDEDMERLAEQLGDEPDYRGDQLEERLGKQEYEEDR